MQGSRHFIATPSQPVPIDTIIDHFKIREPVMTWGELLPLLETIMGTGRP